MANLAETLGKELEALDAEYARDFAGQSRLTRDMDQIDRIIKKVQAMQDRIDQIPVAARGADLERLRSSVVENLKLYSTERQAIERAQAVGPAFELFSTESQNANFVFGRYIRHFAGKDRTTRDLALLAEMVEELKQIEKRMVGLLKEQRATDFERDLGVVRQNMAQYQEEIRLIEEAQAMGTPEEQAGLLATLANEQFKIYQTHFAGESRVSRRPALLMRVIATLKKVQAKMEALKAGGLSVEYNDKNIGIVTDRLAVYETELGEIRKVRQATPMVEIMGELGGAANKLFEEYRKNYADKARSSADPERLGNICDKLAEVRRQMMDMSFAEDNETNLKNLDIVTEQLAMFENEYELVLKAQPANK